MTGVFAFLALAGLLSSVSAWWMFGSAMSDLDAANRHNLKLIGQMQEIQAKHEGMVDLAYRLGRVSGKGLQAARDGTLPNLSEEDLEALEEDRTVRFLGVEVIPSSEPGKYRIVKVDVDDEPPAFDLG